MLAVEVAVHRFKVRRQERAALEGVVLVKQQVL
jgi:hypothetical protein